MAGREGTMLGPYRLTRLLGSGGAGDVYLAEGPTHNGEQGLAAVKVLRGRSSDSAARLIAGQVHAVSGLHQTHVLPIYSVAEDQGAIYVAMAYAPGGPLAASIAPGASGKVALPLAPGVAARFVTQAARALQPVHAQGLVHGDLKMSNIFVRTAPQGGPMVAIADFGQSVVVAAAAAAAAGTQAGDAGWAVASLRCAAPEQLLGQHVVASDQYALATIAYLLLTGRYPFSGDVRSLGTAILHQSPAPPTTFDPTLPPEAEAVLMRALQKAPQARFGDITSFAGALSDALAPNVVRAGITAELSRLTGVSPAASVSGSTSTARLRASVATAVARGGTSGVRRRPTGIPQGPGGSGVRRVTSAPSAPTAPRRRPLTARQRGILAIVGVLALVLGAAGAWGLHALATPSRAQGPLPNFGGLDYAPTVTPNAVVQAAQRKTAQAAEQSLAAATSSAPVFSDTLANNSHQWPVDGHQAFFGSDHRLHVVNHSAQTVASVDQPGQAPLEFAAEVDMTFVHGTLSDLAGLRVRVTSGTTPVTYYTVLISPEGHYEVWRYDGNRWVSLDNGYTQAIKRGLGATNRLAVLGQGDALWLYVNGHYVTMVRVSPPKQTATTMGPTVVYAGTEVAYANYAVYQAGS